MSRIARGPMTGLLLLAALAGCQAGGPRPLPDPLTAGARRAPATPQPAPIERAAMPERAAIEPRSVPVPAPSAARVERLGASLEGRPIDMHVFGAGRPVVFIFAGIHGSEPGSVYVAERLLELLTAEPQHYAGRTVAVAPLTNPDGYRTRRRTNMNRVDLNRNFPASNFKASKLYGTTPASQPETRAVIQAVEQLQPDAIVSIHAITGGRQCNNYNGPAQPLAELMARYNGYPVTGDIGYPTPGSFGTWAGYDQKIPTITLELPRGERGAASWDRNRDALLQFIRAVEPRTARVAR